MNKTMVALISMVALMTVPRAVEAGRLPVGATFPVGTQEILLEGTLNLENHKGSTRADILAGYGYFIIDNMEVGLLGSFRKTEYESAWGINSVWGFGVFGEYNFETGGPLLPFTGLRLMVLDGNESGDTAVNATLVAGVKLMMTRLAALSIGVYYDVASDDIYVIDKKEDNTNLTGKAGFRVFF